MSTELTTIESLYEMTTRRNRAIELIHLIKNAQNELCKVTNDSHIVSDLNRTSPYDGYYDIEKSEKIIDSKFWKDAIDKCKITDLMTDNKRWEYLQLIQNNPPHFCELEIKALEQNIINIYGENFITTVQEVYKNLIGCFYRGTNWSEKKYSNLQKVEKEFKIAGNIYWEDYKYFRYFKYKVCGQN